MIFYYPELPLELLQPTQPFRINLRQQVAHCDRANGGDIYKSLKEDGQLNPSIGDWKGHWLLHPGCTRWRVMKDLGWETQRVIARGPKEAHWPEFERVYLGTQAELENLYLSENTDRAESYTHGWLTGVHAQV